MTQDYSSGRIQVSRDGEVHYRVSLGARELGYINVAEKVFTAKRVRGECKSACKECGHHCHFFRLWNGFGFNAELPSVLRKYGVETICILLKDYSGGVMEQRVLILGKDHWWNSLEEVGKKTLKENKFERQFVVPINEFMVKK